MGTRISIAAYTRAHARRARAPRQAGQGARRDPPAQRADDHVAGRQRDLPRLTPAPARRPRPSSSRDTLAVIEKSVWMSSRSEGVRHHLRGDARAVEVRSGPRGAHPRPRRRSRLRAGSSTGARSRSTTTRTAVMLEKAGMRMSLGGIAKGYAVDAARASSSRRGSPGVLRAGRRRPLRAREEAGWITVPRGRARPARARRQRLVRDARGGRSRLLDRGRLRAQLPRGREALPPHHRSAHRLPRHGLPERDHLGEGRLHGRRRRRRRLHPRTERRARSSSRRSTTRAPSSSMPEQARGVSEKIERQTARPAHRATEPDIDPRGAAHSLRLRHCRSWVTAQALRRARAAFAAPSVRENDGPCR